MLTLRNTLLLALPLLAACPGGTETGETGDTSVTDEFTTEQLQAAVVSTDMGGRWFVAILLVAGLGTPEDCPSVVQKGNTITLTGGCTTDEGQEWTGSATVVESKDGTEITVTYNDLGGYDATEASFLASGTQHGVQDGALTTNMTLTYDDFNGIAASYIYTNHVISDLQGFTDTMFNQTGSWTASGSIEVADMKGLHDHAERRPHRGLRRRVRPGIGHVHGRVGGRSRVHLGRRHQLR